MYHNSPTTQDNIKASIRNIVLSVSQQELRRARSKALDGPVYFLRRLIKHKISNTALALSLKVNITEKG
jgi:hypothetical protein